MAAYADLDDIIDRAGESEVLQVADRDNDGVADAAVVEAALNAADVRINAWLGARYMIPLSATPPIVKSWAVSIGRYLLHRDGAPDHVARDYQDALKELQSASIGKLALPGVDGVRPAGATGGAASFQSSDQVFSDDNLRGFL
jgi:phage gp36-like protein